MFQTHVVHKIENTHYKSATSLLLRLLVFEVHTYYYTSELSDMMTMVFQMHIKVPKSLIVL